MVSTIMKFRLVLIAGLALIVLGASPNSVTSADAAVEVRSILNSVTTDDCPTNCEFGGCGDGRHSNLEHAGGNDGGEVHTCAFSPNQCGDHSCNPEFAQLDGLLPRLDGASIRALEGEGRLAVNLNRSAIQVPGCNGLVVASVGMTEMQRAELGL